jgi:hypothetical protein
LRGDRGQDAHLRLRIHRPGPDDVGLATEVLRHAWEAHGMPLSHDEALLLLFHAELAGATAISWRPQTGTEREEQ